MREQPGLAMVAMDDARRGVAMVEPYARHPQQTELLSLPEAAQWAGVGLPTIMGWIRSGQLPSVRVAARRFVHTADLAATLAAVYLNGVVPAWRQDPQRAGRRLRALREAAGV